MSTKLTALSALSTPSGEDLVYVVDDPSGSAVSKKITLATLLATPILVENLGSNWNKYVIGAGLYCVERTLTNAQILDLHTTKIDLTDAGGAGVAFLPLYTIMNLTWVADYLNIHAGCIIGINAGLNTFGVLREGDSSVSGLLQFGESAMAFIGPNGTTGAGGIGGGSSGYTPAEFSNLPIQIACNNQANGNFTGGDAGNSMKVTCYYMRHSI